MASEVLPEDFFVTEPDSTGRVIITHELNEARQMAIACPNKWVRVGDTRRLHKDMSAWCSEVNTGKKKALETTAGHFVACWWIEDAESDDIGRREYGKAIKFIPGRNR